MSQSVKFTQNAAALLVRAAKLSLGAANDQSGTAVKRRDYNERGFWAKLGDQSGSAPPYQYAWTEQYDTGSNALADKPDGRSGTTSAAFAVSAWEQSGVYTAPPWPALPSGTLVWMQMSFDSASPANPVYRFCAPPEFSEAAGLTLPHGSYGAPDGTTWTRDTDTRAVSFDPFWIGFDSSSENFFMMTRTAQYDSAGAMFAVSAETQTVIATENCS